MGPEGLNNLISSVAPLPCQDPSKSKGSMDRTGQKPEKNEKFRTSSDQDQLLLKSSDQSGPGPTKIRKYWTDSDRAARGYLVLKSGRS